MEVVEKKKLAPMIRFSEFNDDYRKVVLRDLIEFFNGKGHEQDVSEDGDFVLVNSKFVSTDGEVIKRTNNQLVPLIVNDIVMVMSDVPKGRALAKCFLIEENNKFSLNQRIGCFREKEAHNRYLKFLVNRNRYYLEFDSGVGQTNLRKDDVLDCPLKIPTLPEQQKIAAFLSAVDEKIQQLRQKKALLEKYKKGVMQKLFPKKAGEAPELRFKKPDGSNYPDWQVKKLNEISEPIKRTSDTVIEEIMTISGANGFLSQKERFSQVIAGSSLSKYTHLLEGEFAYNRGNSKSFKYGCIYKMPIKEALIPYVYHCFKLHEGNNNDFYQQLFLQKYLDRQLRQLISSSARMDGLLNIGAKEFFKVKLPQPCLEEQERIGKFLSGIDQKINQVETQINQIQTFKKGLLQQMFV